MVLSDQWALPRITTPRLCLRHFTPQDWPELLCMAQTDAVFRHLKQPHGPLCEATIQEQIHAYNDVALLHPGYGTWRVSDQANTFVGVVFVEPVAGCCFGHFGGAGLPGFWGRGYSMETTATMFDYCFGHLGLTGVAAYIQKSNKAAEQCARLCGMRAFVDFEYFGHTTTAFALHRNDWQQRKPLLAMADNATNPRKLLRLLPAQAR